MFKRFKLSLAIGLLCLLLAQFAQATYPLIPGSPLAKACFKSYVSSLALLTCTHTHEDFKRTQNALAVYFTKEGWKEYQQSIKDKGYSRLLKRDEYTVLCTLLHQPKLIHEETKSIENKRFLIKRVAIPLRITFLKENGQPKIEEKELLITLNKSIRSSRFGLIDKVESHALADSKIDYAVDPGFICNLKVDSSLKKPLHSDLELRVWVEEALAHVYHSREGSRYFSDQAWKTFLTLHQPNKVASGIKLQGIYRYDPHIMPALIKSRGLHERTYRWEVINWYQLLTQDEASIDMKLRFSIDRSNESGVRGLLITEVFKIGDKSQQETEKKEMSPSS